MGVVMRRVVLVLSLCSMARSALAESISAAAIGPTKVAVLEIKSTGIDEAVTKNLSELFTAEAGRVPGYKVIGHQEVQDMVGFEIQKQTLGCSDVSCFAEIGGALGVDLIVSGSIGKVGETFVVSMRFIDIKRGETKNRVSESIAGRVELLPDYVRLVAWRLFGQPVPSDVNSAYEATRARLERDKDNGKNDGTTTAMATQSLPQTQAAAAPSEPDRGHTAVSAAPAGGFAWQRLGRNVAGLMIAGGVLYGGTNHLIAYMKDQDNEEAADFPGFSSPADDLRSRAYIGYGFAVVGIIGTIVFTILTPDSPSTAGRIVPTANGLALTF
jgi:hypothetical protein